MTTLELVNGMTYEEAGELILANKPWVTCWECKGTGRESENRNFQCSGCAGFKVILVRGYRVACQLLGKPLPQPPEVDSENAVQDMEDLRGFIDEVDEMEPHDT